MVDLVHKTDARRFEGIVVGQVDAHLPHAALVGRLRWSEELDVELVQASQDGHLVLRFDQLDHIVVHASLSGTGRGHFVGFVVGVLWGLGFCLAFDLIGFVLIWFGVVVSSLSYSKAKAVFLFLFFFVGFCSFYILLLCCFRFPLPVAQLLLLRLPRTAPHSSTLTGTVQSKTGAACK